MCELPDYKRLLAGARLQKLGSYRQALITIKRELLIGLRNQKTNRVVQKKYREQTKDPNPLRVFYVSNSHYRAYLEGFGIHDMPCSLEATGIPSVRLCALSLPSRDRFKSVWNYWKIDVPKAITEIRCWCSRSKMERQLDLKDIVSKTLAVSSRRTLISYADHLLGAPQYSDPLGFGIEHTANCEGFESYAYEMSSPNLVYLVNHWPGERHPDWKQVALEAAGRWAEVCRKCII